MLTRTTCTSGLTTPRSVSASMTMRNDCATVTSPATFSTADFPEPTVTNTLKNSSRSRASAKVPARFAFSTVSAFRTATPAEAARRAPSATARGTCAISTITFAGRGAGAVTVGAG
ncbi:Uncharacterised protein [Mycobacteroides abscessus subsp. bolletii]|nr:Uncharacterised protein [Mycobacteroides abscessus subsp. bolletii]